MLKKQVLTLCLFLALTLLFQTSILAEVTIDPIGFAMVVEEGNETEVELTLINNGEEDVTFNFGYSLIEDEEERRLGPRRDDPGDILEQYQIPYVHTIGLAWDEDRGWMWGVDWTERRLYALDVEEEEITVNIVMNQGLVGLFYWEGVLYGGGYNDNRLVYRYDIEGNAQGTIRLPRSLRDSHIGGDGQFIYTVAYQRGGGRGDVHVFDMENLEEVAVIDCRERIGVDVWGLEWISDHSDGQLWLCNPNRMFQYHIDDDWNAELVQEFATVGGQPGHCGLAHDGENLWRGVYGVNDRNWYVIDDGVREFDMLLAEPEEGVIPGEDSEDITIMIRTEGYEAGLYNVLIEIELAEPEHGLIEISAVITVGDDPTFNLTGVVTDAANGDVVEGAAVDMDCYYITRFSDEGGAYTLNNLPLGVYEYAFTALDYLPYIDTLSIEEAGDFELDASLLHSECNPNRDEIVMELAPEDRAEIIIEISNDGNGPLIYTVERRLPGEANADPWTLRQSFPIGQDVDDSRIQGAVFVDDHFYVAGAHGNEPVIYIFDREGEFAELFAQPGNDRYGMRDLAWDGQLIWGVFGDRIYGITLDGEVRSELQSPFGLTANIAWDPDRERLWVCGSTTDIIAIDLDGNEIVELDRCGLRMYGLAYYPDDPDDHPLYIFARERDTNRPMLHKANPDNRDIIFVTYLDTEPGGAPASAFITNQLDVYSWVFIAVANATDNQGGDRIDIWQIDARMDWMQIDPVEGVIAAGESEEFELVLDAEGLPVEVFEGELIFTHDGIDGETIIPITLSVVEGPVHTQKTLELDMGWNLVSVYLQPDEEDVTALTRELANAGQLLMMKDGFGHFYHVRRDFNNIPGWDVAQGYWIKMRHSGELILEGVTVVFDEPIDLVEGWQIISYYPRIQLDAAVALSGLGDRLLMVKDCTGNFYIPEWDFSNMSIMRAGQGYQVNVSEAIELVYRLQAGGDDLVMGVRNRQGELPVHSNTGNNMSLLLIDNRQFSIDNCQLKIKIDVYANRELVGSGVLENGVCGIAVWGDDPTTTEIDGAVEGEFLELRLLDEKGLHSVQFKTLAGDGVYQTDGFWAVELKNISEIPDKFGLTVAYPNPFNSTTTIEYAVDEAEEVRLSFYDLSGREVVVLFQGERKPGAYHAAWNAVDIPSGVYLCKLAGCNRSSLLKVALVK